MSCPSTTLRDRVLLVVYAKSAGPTKCENGALTSVVGQKRKCPSSRGTSVLPSGADIVSLPRHVRLVPLPDSCTAAKSLFDHLIGTGRANGGLESMSMSGKCRYPLRTTARASPSGSVITLCRYIF